jgi:hypothetical protein
VPTFVDVAEERLPAGLALTGGWRLVDRLLEQAGGQPGVVHVAGTEGDELVVRRIGESDNHRVQAYPLKWTYPYGSTAMLDMAT